MRAGSTGLGNQMLCFNIVFGEEASTGMPPTYPKNTSEMIVMHCKTYDPVVWKLWVGVETSDLLPMIRVIFRWRTIAFLVKWLFSFSQKKPSTVVVTQSLK
jgi:hypothetical protein